MDTKTNIIPDQALRALVDRLLLEQGRLDPLELLLAAQLIVYEDYEAWRTGRRPDLQSALHAAPQEVAGFLERAGAYARGQKLTDVSVRHTAWGVHDAPLCIGAHPGLDRACGMAYAPPPDRHQLDLFHDSTAVLLEDEIRSSLAARRTDRARQQVARLMQQEPSHPRLRDFLRLIQAADDSHSADLGLSPGDRATELKTVEPLAQQLLGHKARDFLSALWADFAEKSAGLRFDPRAPELHAGFAWSRAGRWEAAREAVESQPDWQEHPALVLVHAEAGWHRRDFAAARRDWLSLCWEFPMEAERALCAKSLPDQRLADLWNTFEDLDEELQTEDFPAWLLVRDPGAFAAVLPSSAPNDERGEAYRLLHRMVTGDDSIERRRELGEAHPVLLQLFLKRFGQ
jgi:hypothetical protein